MFIHNNAFARYFHDQTGLLWTRDMVRGNCSFVASVYRKFRGNRGREQYGFYRGPVTAEDWLSKSVAFGLVRHAWLLVDGEIIDPTRWCFLAPGPEEGKIYFTAANDPEYDMGMLDTLLALSGNRECPPVNGELLLACNDPTINGLLQGKVTISRLHWLIHLHPDSEIYGSKKARQSVIRWACRNGHRAMVPMDFWD